MSIESKTTWRISVRTHLDDESTSPMNITTEQLAYNEVEMPMSKIPDMRTEILEKLATEGVEKPVPPGT